MGFNFSKQSLPNVNKMNSNNFIGNKIWSQPAFDSRPEPCRPRVDPGPPLSLFALLSKDGKLMANPRFKTEICRNFKERAKCIYGDKCQFAHGRRELRDVVRNSKYKTKPCQKYWLIGYCAYGPRCNFLHDEASEQELMDWNSIHNDQSVGSTSRPTTPTTLFEVNHDMVEDTMLSKGSLLSMNYQIHPTPIPSKEINDQVIGVWTAP